MTLFTKTARKRSTDRGALDGAGSVTLAERTFEFGGYRTDGVFEICGKDERGEQDYFYVSDAAALEDCNPHG